MSLTTLKTGDLLEGEDGRTWALYCAPYVSQNTVVIDVKLPARETLGGLFAAPAKDFSYQEVLENDGKYVRYVDGIKVPYAACPYFRVIQEHPWFQSNLPAGSPYLLTAATPALPLVVPSMKLSQMQQIVASGRLSAPSPGFDEKYFGVQAPVKKTLSCCAKSIAENGHAKFHLGGLCYACATK